jgi:hypothetical protein
MGGWKGDPIEDLFSDRGINLLFSIIIITYFEILRLNEKYLINKYHMV